MAVFMAMSILLWGCGTSKHLGRWQGYFEGADGAATEELRVFNGSSGTFDGRLNLLYEKNIKGSADSPLLAGNNLIAFKTTRQRFLAFDQATGDKVCQIKKRHGLIINPVLYDSLLILTKKAAFGDIQVINLFTGKIIRKREINDIRSGPIIVRDGLVFGTTKGLLAVSMPDLTTLWQSEDKAIVDIAAVSDDVTVFYTLGNGIVQALRSDDGSLRWEAGFDAAIVSELSLGRYLYFGLADGRMVAVNKQDGSKVWECPLGARVHGGVAEHDGRIYFGSTDGKINCLSQTGELVWQTATEGIVTASPIIYGKTVLVGSHDRHFYSLDITAGRIIDRFRLEGPVTEAAIIDGNRIFVACQNQRFYCFKG